MTGISAAGTSESNQYGLHTTAPGDSPSKAPSTIFPWAREVGLPLLFGGMVAAAATPLLMWHAGSARGQVMRAAIGIGSGVAFGAWLVRPKLGSEQREAPVVTDPTEVAVTLDREGPRTGTSIGVEAETGDESREMFGTLLGRIAGYPTVREAIDAAVGAGETVAIVADPAEEDGSDPVYRVYRMPGGGPSDPNLGSKQPVTHFDPDVLAILSEGRELFEPDRDDATRFVFTQTFEYATREALDRMRFDGRHLASADVTWTADNEVRAGEVLGPSAGYGAIEDALGALVQTEGDQAVLRDPESGRFVVVDTFNASPEGSGDRGDYGYTGHVRGFKVEASGSTDPRFLEVDGLLLAPSADWWVRPTVGEESE